MLTEGVCRGKGEREDPWKVAGKRKAVPRSGERSGLRDSGHMLSLICGL